MQLIVNKKDKVFLWISAFTVLAAIFETTGIYRNLRYQFDIIRKFDFALFLILSLSGLFVLAFDYKFKWGTRTSTIILVCSIVLLIVVKVVTLVRVI